MLYGGGLNGLYQIIGEVLMPIRSKLITALHINKDSEGYKVISATITFILVGFAFIFFRAESIGKAKYIIGSIINVDNPWVLFDGSLYECGLDEKNFRLMIYAIMVLFIVDLLKRKGIKIREIILRQDYWFKGALVALGVLLIMVFGKYGPAYDAANFIYFQF